MEILIVGGGYIGMYTARRLERLLRRGEATVTVVDPRGYMTYQPFLAEAAGGSVEPRHVIAPLPRVLRHTRVLIGKIVSIDHASRLAVFASAHGPERVLRYDVLVMAAGSVSRVLPVEGLAEYGAGFKTVSEAVHLRNHVLSQLAVAASADDPAIRAAALTFVVVGGGFAGVEALAELQGLADERWTRPSCTGCWSSQPAGSCPSSMSDSASGRCARCGGAASMCGCTPSLSRPRTATCPACQWLIWRPDVARRRAAAIPAGG
jgi:NADH dehydrogenase FAD-containing subunit